MDNPRIVLHIGANKTGTSSIQKMLHDSRDALLAKGWTYTDHFQLHMAHHKLAYSILGNPLWGLKYDWQAELRTVMADPDMRFIFSSELFFRVVSPAKTAQFFPPSETQIILYIRDPLSYMMSWYAQAVQGTNTTCSFSDYLHRFSQPLIEYLRGWEAVYGADNVSVRLFERDQLLGRDSRIDFMQFIDGVEPSDMTLDTGDSNLSISGNLLFFKRMLNNFMTLEDSNEVPITDEFGAYAALKDSFHGKFHATHDDIEIVRHLFDPDLRIFAERGMPFKPMPREVVGHPCPNFDTLDEDFAFIMDIARQTGKEFLRFTDRMPNLRGAVQEAE